MLSRQRDTKTPDFIAETNALTEDQFIKELKKSTHELALIAELIREFEKPYIAINQPRPKVMINFFESLLNGKSPTLSKAPEAKAFNRTFFFDQNAVLRKKVEDEKVSIDHIQKTLNFFTTAHPDITLLSDYYRRQLHYYQQEQEVYYGDRAPKIEEKCEEILTLTGHLVSTLEPIEALLCGSVKTVLGKLESIFKQKAAPSQKIADDIALALFVGRDLLTEKIELHHIIRNVLDDIAKAYCKHQLRSDVAETKQPNVTSPLSDATMLTLWGKSEVIPKSKKKKRKQRKINESEYDKNTEKCVSCRAIRF